MKKTVRKALLSNKLTLQVELSSVLILEPLTLVLVFLRMERWKLSQMTKVCSFT